ncbi:MurR/RpiR family transcriptional regulator [Plantibacter sp. Mn2098]|uniref:MurR/RpiR family transcriptional regulator n=1 Tax=Plantibacter sp. Mn2098 TaxID=3395266 RepID=UPI003BBC58D6
MNDTLHRPGERTEAGLQRRSASLLKQRVLEHEDANFARTLAWAKEDPALERAAALIVSARRRFLIGASTSFTYASLLAAELGASLANVTLVDGTIVRPLDVLSDVRSSDVMIAISLQRYRRSTVDFAVPFAQAGGTLVLITDAPDAPLVEHASESIVIGGQGEPGQNSPTAISLVLHVLAMLTTASAKGAARRLIERDRLASTLGVYVEGQ